MHTLRTTSTARHFIYASRISLKLAMKIPVCLNSFLPACQPVCCMPAWCLTACLMPDCLTTAYVSYGLPAILPVGLPTCLPGCTVVQAWCSANKNRHFTWALDKHTNGERNPCTQLLTIYFTISLFRQVVNHNSTQKLGLTWKWLYTTTTHHHHPPPPPPPPQTQCHQYLSCSWPNLNQPLDVNLWDQQQQY